MEHPLRIHRSLTLFFVNEAAILEELQEISVTALEVLHKEASPLDVQHDWTTIKIQIIFFFFTITSVVPVGFLDGTSGWPQPVFVQATAL